MTTKEHYEQHLAPIYSWMAGDFEANRANFQEFLEANEIVPRGNKKAIDLGAGHGIQSIALKKLGFEVTAIDFNDQLLKELCSHPEGKSINTIKTDIRNTASYDHLDPELILCCGDTLTHLDSKTEINQLISSCVAMLSESGKLILSFRDYTKELNDEQRFIHAKSDENRILTCILDYQPEKVKVTDLLYEREGRNWIQRASTYFKVRISANEIAKALINKDMKITYNNYIGGMATIIAEK